MKVLSLLCLLPLSAAPVALTVQPESKHQAIYFTDSGNARVDSIFTGTLLGELTLDEMTGEIVSFRFTGGNLHYGDSVSTYTSDQSPQVDRLTFISTGLAGPLTSVVSEPTVSPVSGLLDNSEHQQIINQGTLQTLYEVSFFGSWVTALSDTRSFVTEPSVSNISGESRIESSFLSGNALANRYHVELHHVTDENPQVLNYGGVEITVMASGGFVATGSMMVPSSHFRNWLLGAPAHLVQSEEVLSGKLAILYALGLHPLDSIPLVVRDGGIALNLPASGTRGEVILEYSTDLLTWDVMPWTAGPMGEARFPVGTSGLQIVPLPEQAKGFVRVAMALP